MASKRKESPSARDAGAQPGKRHKHASAKSAPKTYSQVDATYGQRSFFPEALADESNVDLDSAAALAYLSSVRNEASCIPHLLVAPPSKTLPQARSNTARQRDSYDDHDTSRHSGLYEDGAYFSYSAPQVDTLDMTQTDGDDMSDLAAVEAYHARMLSRFDSIHDALGPEWITRRVDLWQPDLEAIIARPPQPPFLNELMDRPIRDLLGQVQNKLTKARLVGSEREAKLLGSWCWALLARTPEFGTLDNQEVSVVRELGKKAARLAKNLAQELLSNPEAFEPGTETPKHQPVKDGNLNRRRRNSSSSVEGADATELAYEQLEVQAYKVLTHDEAHKISNEAQAKHDAREATRAAQQVRGDNSAEAGHKQHKEDAGVKDEPKAPFQLDSGEEADADGEDDDEGEQEPIMVPMGAVTDDDPDWEDGEWNEDDDDDGIYIDGITHDSTPLTKRHIALCTLDMILTVVGERFGQRDLLPARDMLWELDEVAEAEQQV